MTIHNLYMFDRNGSLIYYKEWSRQKQAGMSMDEEAKLMYGKIYSLKMFVAKVSPFDIKETYLHYSTSTHRHHVYETPSRLRIVLNTDLQVQDIKELLHAIYSQVYVEYAVHNPLLAPNTTITSDLFGAQLDSLVKAHPGFVRA